jgi:hypothetical protein
LTAAAISSIDVRQGMPTSRYTVQRRDRGA